MAIERKRFFLKRSASRSLLRYHVFMMRLLAIALLLLTGCRFFADHTPVPNPDPNHTHADFAVWVNGEKLDFSGAEYMSGTSTDEQTHDEVDEYLDEYLHLHDEVGHVIHRHKPGLTLLEFLKSLGLTVRDDAIYIPDRGDIVNWEMGGETWRLFINGQLQPQYSPLTTTLNYQFQDMDQILLVFGHADANLDAAFDQMTNDACLYSKTCPWRGNPPVENCIADPEVPCVLPDEE